ncbi:protein FAM177B-like [Vombatus ursinus]|uniref:protein FAM177B-like n=1 Tax=Vombatus ursinus TaxID=29139 RepID=UPI000FFD5599|nr:protein FAM177B-like [Vombatus ursinus]XP_027726663.1 protein FAM177B-like [Vombatus ursinus]
MENAKDILQDDSFPKSGLEKRETTKRIIPKRIIHFANGDTIDEYSTEEEDDEKEELKNTPTLATSKLPWGPYLRFWAVRMTSATFSTCDFLGGKLATLFGLDEPKYQYLLNEYYRTQNQEKDKKADEEAQSTEVSDEKQCLDIYGKQYGTNE